MTLAQRKHVLLLLYCILVLLGPEKLRAVPLVVIAIEGTVAARAEAFLREHDAIVWCRCIVKQLANLVLLGRVARERVCKVCPVVEYSICRRAVTRISESVVLVKYREGEPGGAILAVHEIVVVGNVRGRG